MPIRVQTALGTDIVNEQLTEVSTFERNWSVTLAGPQRDIRTEVSGKYNCHGLTFASRRTRLWDNATVATILAEDSYVEITTMDQVLPGDVIVYYGEQGDATHSGVVVQNDATLPRVPRVVSKWGNGPELVHRYWDVHPVYGTQHRFFRCRLQ